MLPNPQKLILTQEEYDSLNKTTEPSIPEPKPSSLEEELKNLSDNDLLEVANKVTRQKAVDLSETESLLAELRSRRWCRKFKRKGVSKYTVLINRLERLIAKNQRIPVPKE